MCGIIGYIGKEKIDRSVIKSACDLISHRGPDDSGIFEDKLKKNYIYLGHQRLSIIDLNERSKQPFRYKDTVLVFNGEIYNYLEVKEELKTLGHKFLTSGDTEVLSHALNEWGRDAFEKLDGMWSFAYLNTVSGEVLLSRDRFGEKPLYIWKTKLGVYFASEVKSLFKLAGKNASINESQIFKYLVNGYKSLYKKKKTFFNEISELDSSTSILINKDLLIDEKRYWLPNYTQNLKLSYSDAVSITREKLILSVKQKIRSDVPLAFCMSGGIDSNCLISIAKKELGHDVHGFTIKSSDERYSEEDLVDNSLDYLNIKHTYVPTNKKDFIKNITNQIISHDSPVYTIAFYIHWQLMKAMSDKGYKVSISGTGADEIFTGYYDHHLFYLNEIRKDENLFSSSMNNWKKNISPIVRNPFLQDPECFIKSKKKNEHIYLNNEIFSDLLKNKWIEDFEHENFTNDGLRNRMINEMFIETVPVMLHEDDLNAMYYSIENRSPFLDRGLFEFGHTIPTRHLIKDGYTKSVLRDSMRGIVSDKVLNSFQKKGFNASLKELIDFEDKDIRAMLLDDSKIFDYIKKDKIEKLFKIKNLENSYSKFLFNFINAKIFLENY